MTGVKSKKDRPVKNPKENVPLSLEASAMSSTRHNSRINKLSESQPTTPVRESVAVNQTV